MNIVLTVLTILHGEDQFPNICGVKVSLRTLDKQYTVIEQEEAGIVNVHGRQIHIFLLSKMQTGHVPLQLTEDQIKGPFRLIDYRPREPRDGNVAKLKEQVSSLKEE